MKNGGVRSCGILTRMSKKLTFRTVHSNIEHFHPESRDFFRLLLELTTGVEFEYQGDSRRKVDVSIESTYDEGATPSNTTRSVRFLQSRTARGVRFNGSRFTPNQQPIGNSRFSIFYSAENHRPPEGIWDAYLTFDQYSFGGRNAYLPLWWITSTDLLRPTKSPFLKREISIEGLMQKRTGDFDKRQNFCVAFSGKAWPFRMHALTALNAIGRVDVYGNLARQSVESKSAISSKYKFILCFENDLYPGYVTEKLPEAWMTGAVPLYWGLEQGKYFNERAYLNLANYHSENEFYERVARLSNSASEWNDIASQPLLKSKPDLSQVLAVLRKALAPLVSREVREMLKAGEV